MPLPADSERRSVLIRLLRTYLRPYKKPIALLVALQFLQTCATLYLPTLNAHIIDNGVVEGDTGYILSFGGVMIGISLAQVVCNIGAVYYGARTASALGRDLRGPSSTGCSPSPPARSASSAPPR